MKKLVKCPSCGWTQFTHATKSVKCIRCGKSYTLLPKTKLSRIKRIV